MTGDFEPKRMNYCEYMEKPVYVERYFNSGRQLNPNGVQTIKRKQVTLFFILKP